MNQITCYFFHPDMRDKFSKFVSVIGLRNSSTDFVIIGGRAFARGSSIFHCYVLLVYAILSPIGEPQNVNKFSLYNFQEKLKAAFHFNHFVRRPKRPENNRALWSANKTTTSGKRPLKLPYILMRKRNL